MKFYFILIIIQVILILVKKEDFSKIKKNKLFTFQKNY